MNITIFLISLLSFIFGFFVAFIASYFKKKGENQAVLEDIKTITMATQSVVNEYARDIERLKGEVHRNNFRYQKEYEILVVLAKHLNDLEEAATKLHRLSSLPIPSSKQDNEINIQTLQKLVDLSQGFLAFTKTHGPFMPSHIQHVLEEELIFIILDKMGVTFLRNAKIENPNVKIYTGKGSLEEENNEFHTKFTAALKNTREAIRTYIIKWE